MLIPVVLLLGLVGFYAYRSWTSKPPAPLVGQARVLDGDSIEISGARIRLQGIDAPEWEQTCVDAGGEAWPCGKAAAQELRRHIGARDLRCESSGFDHYNRFLATCFDPDGADLNAWLVRRGWKRTAYVLSRRYSCGSSRTVRAMVSLVAGAVAWASAGAGAGAAPVVSNSASSAARLHPRLPPPFERL